MNIKDYWLSLKEVEENYEGIKAVTLRSYIFRNQVIPEDCYTKIGGAWIIKKEWVDKKYKPKARN